MKFAVGVAIALVVFTATGGFAQEQTLTLQLLQESPEKLALEARESGNIIRGAILFRQGNINCAKCHESDSLAPDLSRLGENVTDTSLVESILAPSKAISKGYETTNVQTGDGRVLIGVVASQNDDFILLRDNQDVEKLHKISRVDIQEIRPGKVSSMPDGLVNQMSGRKQFLDLLRYVIDLKERGPTKAKPANQIAPPRELTPELKGMVLIREKNCTACHDASSIDSLPAVHHGPNLKWSARRLNPRHLARFIENPQQSKPGTNMPALMEHLDGAAKEATAEAIVHFLVSIAGNEYQSSPSGSDKKAVNRGRDLFHSVGCVACHSPRDENGAEQILDDSVAMGNLANKYDFKSLIEFLKDPHVVRPSGRMPNMQLTHREAQDLSEYLLQSNGDAESSAEPLWTVDQKMAGRGKVIFKELNCANCHAGIVDAAASSSKKLADANVDRGCLSSDQGNWPNFGFSRSETADIKAAIGSGLKPLDQQQTIDFTLASFNCTVCHSRNSLGGVNQQRRQHFQTTNLNLGEQGRIPPTLTGVGAKLKSKWMRDVLVNGRTVRPYMKTRMPQYGEANVGHLVELFGKADNLPETKFASLNDVKDPHKIGLNIVGNRGLNCAACHTYRYKKADTMPAVDLTEMAERLKKDWFYQYMLDPQTFSPNTVMPSYWPGRKALRADIAGSPEDQIEAIWQYLLDGRQARAPAGVIKEPLEIVVTNEARMLRRQYPEIGKRGIGVGYPGGVNLAFDAQQMRLATIWRGKFVDPAAAWYGQGSGNVRAMGRPIQLAQGPELFDANTPVELNFNRSPVHQFKGYSLGEGRRPTLRYEFGSIAVEDFFTEYKDDTTGLFQLRRRVKLTSTIARDKLWFRLANSDKIKVESDTRYRVDERLTIEVTSGQKIDVADETLLYLALKLKPQQTQEIVIEYFIE
jgi:putative heme-binding domain-containing protein